MSFTATTGAKGSPDPVDQQLSEVEARLVAQYSGQAGLSEQTVRQHFAEIQESFAGARIRSFPADPGGAWGARPACQLTAT